MANTEENNIQKELPKDLKELRNQVIGMLSEDIKEEFIEEFSYVEKELVRIREDLHAGAGVIEFSDKNGWVILSFVFKELLEDKHKKTIHFWISKTMYTIQDNKIIKAYDYFNQNDFVTDLNEVGKNI